MRLPAELCKMQRKKRETDGFLKNTLMTPPGSHPTSGFGARALSNSPMDFSDCKYDHQAADFQGEAIWGVIWLADK
jgi:hypothetical protein